MSLSISSVSLLLLPRGGPSLESHSPSSPFTHHEEKIQNMWCASLIFQLLSATTTSEGHIHCHISSPDIWLCHDKKPLYLVWHTKLLLFKYYCWHFWLMSVAYQSLGWLKSPFHHKNASSAWTVYIDAYILYMLIKLFIFISFALLHSQPPYCSCFWSTSSCSDSNSK